MTDQFTFRNKEIASRAGSRGGKAKVLKGTAKLKVTDPEAYERSIEKKRQAALKWWANKRREESNV